MEKTFSADFGLKFTERWWDLTPEQRKQYSADIVSLFERYSDKVTLRGAYVTQAFRADTDIFLWMYSTQIEDIQAVQLELRRSPFGRYVTTPWSFVGLSQPAEFNKNHVPSYLSGEPARDYLCFYPYIRTSEWYLLPDDERAVMLKEHGDVGRETPGILTNGVHAFGLGDFEWLLSFEMDDLSKIVKAIRDLRATQARKYTKYEWPFIVGRRYDLAHVLAQYQ